MTLPLRRLAVSTAAALLIVGAGALAVDQTIDSGSGSNTEQQAASSDLQGPLTIEDFTYSPDPLQVSAGAKIGVENRDATSHTVTSASADNPDGVFDVRVGANGGAEFEVDEPGTYDFVCQIHPDMHGTLEVSP